jgi:glycosyltransferase involved in cell wall biosynthesis
MRIFAFHLLNDFSGSPKVLMQLLKGWVANDIDVTLVTCSGRDGFLTGIQGVKHKTFWYRWAANPYLRLVNLSLSQLMLFFKFLFVIRKNDIVYINTVLPFGAAILGKIKGCRVIYHIHETTMTPLVFKKFLFGIARATAQDVIYVSDYLAKQEEMKDKRLHILYNAIEDSFLEKAQATKNNHLNSKTVLMVCSLKAYKGVREFVALANLKLHYKFILVVNATQKEIDDFFIKTELPANIKIYPTQTNLHPFYQSAGVMLNLSRVDGWIETFGLTIIEGMAYGLPAIVPPIGGITELIEEDVNGYKIDSRNLNLLSEKIELLFENQGRYEVMSERAIEKIKNFKEAVFVKKNLGILQEKFG